MSRRGWALFAAMSVIWGIPYLLIKVAVGGVPVPVLVLARVAIGAALLLPLAIRRRAARRRCCRTGAGCVLFALRGDRRAVAAAVRGRDAGCPAR